MSDGAAPRIAALVARARGAWPALAVDDARFAAYLAVRLGDDDGLYVEDLYLACACVDQLPRALAAFDDRYLTIVPRYLVRLDRSPSFADEVRQRLRERLFLASDGEPARLSSYSGRGPLGTWVRIAAIRLALNLRRGDRDASLAPADEPMIAGNPELLLLRHRHRADFNAAFALAVATLTVDQRQLLRLHFLDSLSLGEVAALHHVDKSTVSRWLQVAREALFVETERRLRARLNLGEGEAGSLIRLMRSHFGDVSVARLLRANDAV
jgi:RNA polymerase sigma-70 factor (ECF subfamily)